MFDICQDERDVQSLQSRQFVSYTAVETERETPNAPSAESDFHFNT